MTKKKFNKDDFPLLTLLNENDNPSDLDLLTAVVKSFSRMSDKEQTETLIKMLKVTVGTE